MDNRLIFQAYAGHNLDDVAYLFEQRTSREPEFFAVRPDWEYTGKDSNKEKVIASDLVGNGCIFIPLFISLREFQQIEATRQERRGVGYNPHTHIQTDNGIYVSRYCSYCGRLYQTDPDVVVVHCGLQCCEDRHNEYLLSITEAKKDAREKRLAIVGNNDKPENKPLPDFTLYDTERKNDMGWVYFIQAENGLVKIGRSDDVEKRLGDLLTMSPVRLRLFHVVAATNFVRAEAWMHSQFSARRHHGEWFGLSDADLAWVQELHDFSLDSV